MAKASGGTRAKGANSSTGRIIDRTSYSDRGGGMWEFDNGSGKYGYVTILKSSNPYAAYDGIKNIYEVDVASKDFKKEEKQKFGDGFAQAKRWGKEKLKEFNK